MQVEYSDRFQAASEVDEEEIDNFVRKMHNGKIKLEPFERKHMKKKT